MRGGCLCAHSCIWSLKDKKKDYTLLMGHVHAGMLRKLENEGRHELVCRKGLSPHIHEHIHEPPTHTSTHPCTIRSAICLPLLQNDFHFKADSLDYNVVQVGTLSMLFLICHDWL